MFSPQYANAVNTMAVGVRMRIIYMGFIRYHDIVEITMQA